MQNNYSLADAELAVLLKQGDQQAYTEIYNRYHAAIYIHIYNKLQNREEARDLVHDLFSNLWLRRQEIDLKTTLAAYLYSAARYKLFDLIAHNKVQNKYLDSIGNYINNGECITDHLVREKQLMQLIEEEIWALPPKMREIFELSRKEQLSHQQIADKLGISDKTVKKQVNNALKILRSKFGVTVLMVLMMK